MDRAVGYNSNAPLAPIGGGLGLDPLKPLNPISSPRPVNLSSLPALNAPKKSDLVPLVISKVYEPSLYLSLEE